MRRIAHFKYGNKEVEINVSTVLQTGVLQSPVYSGVFYVTFSLLVCVFVFSSSVCQCVVLGQRGEARYLQRPHRSCVVCGRGLYPSLRLVTF